MTIVSENGGLIITLPKGIYSEAVVFKCFYWFSGKFEVMIDEMDASLIQVSLKSINEDWDINETISKIKRDLVDYRLRQIIQEETGNLRELIAAKAFAYEGL